jgi:catechol 2,3-dioxygenase-like lactoylglutathione lyase family enzyme
MDDSVLKIAMRCADLTASKGFYGDALGLELVDEWEESHGNGCIYAMGAGLLELNERKNADRSPDEPVDRFDLQLRVPDLGSWIDRIDGRWDHSAVKEHPWGERTIRMRDPDGVLVTIYEEVE